MSHPLDVDDWVVDPDARQSFKCAICSHLLSQPVNLSTCSHTFCRPCLQQLVPRALSCSICRTPFSSTLQSILSTPDCINGFCNEQLRKVKVSCPFCDEWHGALGIDHVNVMNHFNECGNVPVLCGVGCERMVIRSQLATHEKAECPQRLVQCDRCQEDFPFCQLPQHSINDKECENSHLCKLGCGEVVKDVTLDLHIKDNCSHRPVNCPVCDISLPYHQLENHLQTNLVNHFTALATENKWLRQQVKELQDRAEPSDQRIRGLSMINWKTFASEANIESITDPLYVFWADLVDTWDRTKTATSHPREPERVLALYLSESAWARGLASYWTEGFAYELARNIRTLLLPYTLPHLTIQFSWYISYIQDSIWNSGSRHPKSNAEQEVFDEIKRRCETANTYDSAVTKALIDFMREKSRKSHIELDAYTRALLLFWSVSAYKGIGLGEKMRIEARGSA